MSSKALQIAEAVKTLLQTPALTGIGTGGVVDDPDYDYVVADLPMVAVYMGDETSERLSFSQHQHTLIVTVRITAKKGGVSGKSALLSCDPLMVAIHARLMADLSLGGKALDIRQATTRRQRDVIEVPVAFTEIDYEVDYVTSTTSLES